MDNLKFLTSVRFWKITICAVVVYLQQLGFITPELATLIVTIAGASVIVRTVDRFSEKINKFNE